MSINPILSWKKDKFDKRDYLHKYMIQPVSIPTAFTLSSFCPSVRDQGNVGSCTGFGIGGSLTGLAKQKKLYTQWFSPNWIYNGARYIEGTLTRDLGAEPRNCYSWIKQKGCLLESYWPYNSLSLDTKSPPSDYNDEASQYPLLTYVRVTGGSSGICSALAAGNFVAIGTPWFSTWMKPSTSTGILPPVTTSSVVVGGHMTFLYAYDITKKAFGGMNSWGSSWGYRGSFWMPFSAFDSVFNYFGGYDAYYVTTNWGSSTITTQKMIRIQQSTDGGTTWTDVYKNNSL